MAVSKTNKRGHEVILDAMEGNCCHEYHFFLQIIGNFKENFNPREAKGEPSVRFRFWMWLRISGGKKLWGKDVVNIIPEWKCTSARLTEMACGL